MLFAILISAIICNKCFPTICIYSLLLLFVITYELQPANWFPDGCQGEGHAGQSRASCWGPMGEWLYRNSGS